MSGIPGILLMTGTHNVLWTLECLGSSSGKRKKKRKPGEEVEKSGEMGGGGRLGVVMWYHGVKHYCHFTSHILLVFYTGTGICKKHD